MQIPDSIQANRCLVEERLEKLIPQIEGPHSLLYEAARYSLFSPAKRLRPLLVLSVLADSKKPVIGGLDPACALEMIHTYSLIHDDLPCMDDDNLRRGKPTLHKVYGEGQAVLAGDFLLTHAFHVIAEADLSPELKVTLTSLLSQRAGGNGMIGGQVIDLLSESKAISLDTLQLMYTYKTAALLATALEFGARIGGLSTGECEALTACGFAFGMGFQMLDDILDVIAEEKDLGKPIGSDIENHKSTCLTVYGTEKALDEAHLLFEQALELAKGWEQVTYLIEQCNAKLPGKMTLNK